MLISKHPWTAGSRGETDGSTEEEKEAGPSMRPRERRMKALAMERALLRGLLMSTT